MFTDRSLKRRLLAWVAAGGMSLAGTGHTLAADCNCHTACATCAPEESGCTCDCSGGRKHNCLHKAIHAVAGGIGKLLHRDKCGCKEQLCDDGCDAAMIEELMVPAPPMVMHHGHHSASEHPAYPHLHHHPAQPLDHPNSAPVHSAPVQEPYQGPTRDVQLTPTGPSQWEGAGRTPLPQGQHLGSPDPLLDPEMGSVPPPVRLPGQIEPVAPQLDEPMDRESLFDTLSDPFRDDQTKARSYRRVRPSSYDAGDLQPISRLPLPSDEGSSSRRASSIR